MNCCGQNQVCYRWSKRCVNRHKYTWAGWAATHSFTRRLILKHACCPTCKYFSTAIYPWCSVVFAQRASVLDAEPIFNLGAIKGGEEGALLTG